ncbi:MAG: hypothetical protein H7123_07275 [Thermoleophilia bacterium]|nr:hypothetical protein [Thermoleophilia bacterium]
MTMTTYPIKQFTAVNVTLREAQAAHPKRLFVDRDGNAYVARHTGEVHHLQLDAEHAGELVEAMAGVAHHTTAAMAPAAGTHDLELRWGTQTIHVHGAQLAADEALHGALDVAHRVANRVLDHGTQMEIHAVPADEVIGNGPAIDPNIPHIMVVPGNGGIVPPWLQHDQVRAANGNGGVVPPWLQNTDEILLDPTNDGVAPPWQERTDPKPDLAPTKPPLWGLEHDEVHAGNGNGGIVPPWLQ